MVGGDLLEGEDADAAASNYGNGATASGGVRHHWLTTEVGSVPSRSPTQQHPHSPEHVSGVPRVTIAIPLTLQLNPERSVHPSHTSQCMTTPRGVSHPIALRSRGDEADSPTLRLPLAHAMTAPGTLESPSLLSG